MVSQPNQALALASVIEPPNQLPRSTRVVTFHLRAADAWAEKMKPPQVPSTVPVASVLPQGRRPHLRPPPFLVSHSEQRDGVAEHAGTRQAWASSPPRRRVVTVLSTGVLFVGSSVKFRIRAWGGPEGKLPGGKSRAAPAARLWERMSQLGAGSLQRRGGGSWALESSRPCGIALPKCWGSETVVTGPDSGVNSNVPKPIPE